MFVSATLELVAGLLLFYSPSGASLSPSDGLQLSSWIVSPFSLPCKFKWWEVFLIRKQGIAHTRKFLSTSSKSYHQRAYDDYPFCFHNHRNKPQIIYMFCSLVT